jgi:hypothetical protein
MDTLIQTNIAVPNYYYQARVLGLFELMPQGGAFPVTESENFVEEWMRDEPRVVRELSIELKENPTWLLAKLQHVEKWVMYHQRQFVELNHVMPQLEDGIQTTTVTEVVNNIEWTFKLYKISTTRIKGMARRAFRNQEGMHAYLCNFADDGPSHSVANPRTRATDIRACRHLWSRLRVQLNRCRVINNKWSSHNDTNCLSFNDSPILVQPFTYSSQDMERWYDVEDQEPQQEAFLVGVEDRAVTYFRANWGRKYGIYGGNNNGPGGTFYAGVQSSFYLPIWNDMPNDMPNPMMDDLLVNQQNRVWTALGAGDRNNA